MMAHTEIPTRGKEEQTFLVSQEISETGEPKCVYEYTNTQKNHLISTGMDGKNPFTYREMEDYLKLQRTSLKMIKTEKKCGARGVIISEENSRKIDMNRDDEVADRSKSHLVVFTPTQLDQRIQTARAVDGEQRG